jgi:multiple sugar transport system ATP-binding protein
VTGVRPEDLEVTAGAAPAGEVGGRIYVVEPMGAETWVTVEVAGERVIGRAGGDFQARSGDPVWLRCQAERALLFDRRSGRRVER